ncbi:hypothetical protein PYCC9005_000006 [Savitreella phatthalungensis]
MMMVASSALASNTKPETFMLTPEQQEQLPFESKQALEQVDDLKYFLATAPANWQVDQIIRRYLLPTGEYVSCVLWRNLFHITGTDIVRALTYRFQAFGRPVKNVKKFEEGIFSDLRNLKPGTDASLEEPKSPFLDLLYKNNCIRTQKKQKVFYWFSVPHDRLFLDALERDLKRERMGLEATTVAVAEPALSFVFDATQSLYEQLTKTLQHSAASEAGASLVAQQAQQNMLAAQLHRRSQSVSFEDQTHSRQPSYSMQPPLQVSSIRPLTPTGQGYPDNMQHAQQNWSEDYWDASIMPAQGHPHQPMTAQSQPQSDTLPQQHHSQQHPVQAAQSFNPGHRGSVSLHNFHLFEGSPTYKQRRRRQSIPTNLLLDQDADDGDNGRNGPFVDDSALDYRRVEEPNGSTFEQGHARHAHSLDSFVPFDQQISPSWRFDTRDIAAYADGAADADFGALTSENGRREATPKSETGDPYPARAHTCPLASCGRLFHKLEHLQRHVKTHQWRNYLDPPPGFLGELQDGSNAPTGDEEVDCKKTPGEPVVDVNDVARPAEYNLMQGAGEHQPTETPRSASFATERAEIALDEAAVAAVTAAASAAAKPSAPTPSRDGFWA